MARAFGVALVSLLFGVACGGASTSDGVSTDEQAVVFGTVWLRSGNWMPPGQGEMEPVSRRVVAFDALVEYPDESVPARGSTVSGADGRYELRLAPGRYSLLLEEPAGSWYANSATDDFAELVELEDGEQLEHDLTINYGIE